MSNIEAKVYKQYHLDIPLGLSGVLSTITGFAEFQPGDEGRDSFFDLNFKINVGFNNVINEPIGTANISAGEPFDKLWYITDFKVSWLPDTTELFCSLTIHQTPKDDSNFQVGTIPFQIFVHHN